MYYGHTIYKDVIGMTTAQRNGEIMKLYRGTFKNKLLKLIWYYLELDSCKLRYSLQSQEQPLTK